MDGWAIDLRLKGHPQPCWMGILHVTGGREPAPGMDGNRTAIFKTRAAARAFLELRKMLEGVRTDGIYYWRRAAVRRVWIDVSADRPIEGLCPWETATGRYCPRHGGRVRRSVRRVPSCSASSNSTLDAEQSRTDAQIEVVGSKATRV